MDSAAHNNDVYPMQLALNCSRKIVKLMKGMEVVFVVLAQETTEYVTI